ncbi:hypothetical protein OFM39_33195, partial [Escherichia coli]|nr:hypothetical protein [Escherichia coli]
GFAVPVSFSLFGCRESLGSWCVDSEVEEEEEEATVTCVCFGRRDDKIFSESFGYFCRKTKKEKKKREVCSIKTTRRHRNVCRFY